MRIILLGLAALLAGCASGGPTWYKNGATQATFDADKAECQYEATKHGGSFSPSFGQSYAVAMHRNDITMACLRQKGYSTVAPTVKQEEFKPIPVNILRDGKPVRIN